MTELYLLKKSLKTTTLKKNVSDKIDMSTSRPFSYNTGSAIA
jgi:hypothetical protein